MNPSQQASPKTVCDSQRIHRFLESNHFRIEDNDLVMHLNQCADCRLELEKQAGDTKYWDDASTLLKPTEFDLAGDARYSVAGTTSVQQQHPVAVQDALDCLAPTDDPHHLGRIGTYEVTGVVGVGGMGVVLKAIDPSLDRVVAIKMMGPRLANNETARKRFAREAKAAAAVMHPNVIPIHSVSSESSVPYLVMAFNRGSSLQKRIERDAPLQIVEVLRIGSQIAAGLAAAHEQGLVHRDIKPENILLEEGVERVAITDFGLARAIDDNSVTQCGVIAGTPMYMSPEQARGEQIDQQSDLFSLGSVLYALCTGRPPYRADSSYGVMRRIIDESPTAVRELNPEIPEWFAKVLDKLMSKAKSDRFTSASDVHKLLEACLSHVQQPTAFPLPTIPGVHPGVGKKSFLKTKIGVLTMSLMTAGAVICAILFSQVQRQRISVDVPAAQASVGVADDSKKPAAITPSLIVESHRGEGSDGRGETMTHRWKLKGQSVGSMTVRVLHIEDGKSRVVSESKYQGGVEGEQNIEVELQLESIDQPLPFPGGIFVPTMAVSVNGLQSKAVSGERFALMGSVARHGMTENGQLAPMHILMHTAHSSKGVEYAPTLDSMFHASQQGASFLVTLIDWNPVGATIQRNGDDNYISDDPLVQTMESQLSMMRKVLANPSDYPQAKDMTAEQLEAATQQANDLEAKLKDRKRELAEEASSNKTGELPKEGKTQESIEEDSIQSNAK